MYQLIRASEDKHFPEVTAITKESINENDPVSEKAVDLKFFNVKHKLIGEASVSAIDTNDAFLYNVEVFPGHKGLGYGNSITEYCITHYPITTLTVEPTNKRAINLYKKFGFKVTESFEENDIEYYVMKRDLNG